MILDDNVKVKMGGKNIKYFKIIYPDVKFLQEIIVPINQLSDGSNVKINCKCDVCNKERYITYQKYRDSEKLYGKYSCQKCSHSKRKQTNKNIYGVENYVETIEFEKKSKITTNEKYGFDNVFQNDEIKEKIKNHWIKNCGVEHISQTIEYKEKIKINNKEKYGFEHYYQSDDFKEKSNKTKIERYDDVNYVNIEKCIETRTQNNNMVPDCKLSEWKLYKRKIRKLTRQHKKELLKNWNGYDYYDNKYIKENFNLYSGNKKYPTIDHKKSVFYCFKNNISVEECTNINNLCMTSRSNNSKKHYMTEEEFVNNSL